MTCYMRRMTCLADISFRSEGTLCGLPPGPRRRLASQAKDVDCERCLRALAEIRAADPPKVSVERLRVIVVKSVDMARVLCEHHG